MRIEFELAYNKDTIHHYVPEEVLLKLQMELLVLQSSEDL